MVNGKKSIGKTESRAFVALIVLMVIFAAACQKDAPTSDVIDSGDEKIAAEKIAEAEPLYAGREDLGKARQALALLREARTADYGSYEAYWKLARADYYVAEHTTDSRERDDLFREGVRLWQGNWLSRKGFAIRRKQRIAQATSRSSIRGSQPGCRGAQADRGNTIIKSRPQI